MRFIWHLSNKTQYLQLEPKFQLGVRFIILAVGLVLLILNTFLYIKKSKTVKGDEMKMETKTVKKVEAEVVEVKEEKVENKKSSTTKKNSSSTKKSTSTKKTTSKSTKGTTSSKGKTTAKGKAKSK